jgi:hypothetical protein
MMFVPCRKHIYSLLGPVTEIALLLRWSQMALVRDAGLQAMGQVFVLRSRRAISAHASLQLM